MGRRVNAFLWASLLVVVSSAGFAKELPETTHDGLVLKKDSKARAVYVTPGASLESYNKVLLLDCYVAFRKDWEKDHNRSETFSQRVKTEDMDRIKKDLAAEFRKVFSKELSENGGYEMVDAVADDVLILRPAIINLDVTAPDLNTPAMVHTVVASAGQMTLFLELYDGPTGSILARVVDPQADRGDGVAMQANKVTNRADADRILRKWSDELRKYLDSVHKDGA